MLGELAGDYPLLATLVERTAGVSRRCRWASRTAESRRGLWSSDDALHATVQGSHIGAADTRAADDVDAARAPAAPGATSPPTSHGAPPGTRGAAEAEADAQLEHDARAQIAPVRLPGRGRTRVPTTLSLQIRFETLPETTALARLIESVVYVNDAHAAWRRAASSRAEGYHIALAVAAALAPLAVEPHDAQRFISDFLARWGAAADVKPR